MKKFKSPFRLYKYMTDVIRKIYGIKDMSEFKNYMKKAGYEEIALGVWSRPCIVSGPKCLKLGKAPLVVVTVKDDNTLDVEMCGMVRSGMWFELCARELSVDNFFKIDRDVQHRLADAWKNVY